MPDLAKSYTDKIYRGLRYLPTWFPSTRVSVGDVARIEERVVTRQKGLADLDVEFSIDEHASVAHRAWASKGALAIGSGAGAETGTGTGTQQMGAHIHVDFNARHAVLFRAERSRELNLAHQALIEKKLLSLYEEERWELDWILVTHVVRAARFIALISEEQGAHAELKVTGALAGAAGLDREEIGMEVLHTTGMAYSDCGVVDATPLYRAIRVRKKRLVRGRTTTRVGPTGRARTQGDEFEIVEVEF